MYYSVSSTWKGGGGGGTKTHNHGPPLMVFAHHIICCNCSRYERTALKVDPFPYMLASFIFRNSVPPLSRANSAAQPHDPEAPKITYYILPVLSPPDRLVTRLLPLATSVYASLPSLPACPKPKPEPLSDRLYRARRYHFGHPTRTHVPRPAIPGRHSARPGHSTFVFVLERLR